MMTLLSLSAFFGRLAPAVKTTQYTLHLLNFSALSSTLLIFFAFYTNETVVLLWLLSMWLWHLLALGIMMYCLSYLIRI
jgi:hypothetical protein